MEGRQTPHLVGGVISIRTNLILGIGGLDGDIGEGNRLKIRL